MAFKPDFDTIAVVCTAVNIVVNVGFWTVFWRRLSSPEVQFWCIGLFLNMVGSVLLLGVDRHSHIFFGLTGGVLQVSYMGFVLLGFQSFFKRSLDWSYVVIVPLIYLVSVAPFAGADIAVKIGSVEIFAALALGAMLVFREIILQNNAGGLTSAVLAGTVYSSFALYQAVCVILALLFPITRTDIGIQSGWVGWAMLYGVLHKGMCALVIVVLYSDRIENQLRILADTDMLTGIANRRSFVSQVELLLKNPPQNMMLAIIDLDHFKRVNDTYGHVAGDKVLKAFAAHVASELTPSMRFGRLGGEEFALFAPVKQPHLSFELLDKLRESVSNIRMDFTDESLVIRMSIGVSFSNVSGNDLDAMMVAADIALYTAKREGRNRVCEFHPSQRLTQFFDESDGVSSVDIRKLA